MVLSQCMENTEVELTGHTVKLGGIHYYIKPRARAYLSPDSPQAIKARNSHFAPITILQTSGEIEQASTGSALAKLRQDDVFQERFLATVLVQDLDTTTYKIYDNGSPKAPRVVSLSLLSHHNAGELLQGPHFLSPDGNIYPAYRLYSDFQGAFSETLIKPSTSDGDYAVLPANLQGQSLAVAVPSRLYFRPSTDKPLAGVRVGIKDIFDIRGMKTSQGNRAWYDLYPPVDHTAPAVQKLIDAGAIIVGKMKTSQFGNAQVATADWVDYHAPFNPRGDGYQDASSSSSGPAAGIASYDWLDVAIGTDTGGSIRSPCQIQGIYGNRPTHGSVSLAGAGVLAPEFDTAGILARDPTAWYNVAKVLYGDMLAPAQRRFPRKILTVGFGNPDLSKKMATQLQKFLQDLQGFLDASVQPFDIEEAWAADCPGRPPLKTLLAHTYETVSAKRQAQLVRDKFYNDYSSVHNRRLPHVDPSPLARWKFGDGADEATIDLATRANADFSDWFNDKVLPQSDPAETLLVYVPRIPTPRYRDTYLSGPSRPYPFAIGRAPVLAGVPDFVLPIGEISYESKVTGKTEVLPLTVDFMAARGADGMLFRLIEDLHASGLLKESKAGRSVISGGKILR